MRHAGREDFHCFVCVSHLYMPLVCFYGDSIHVIAIWLQCFLGALVGQRKKRGGRPGGGGMMPHRYGVNPYAGYGTPGGGGTMSTPTGLLPTGIVAATVSLAVSITETLLEAKFVI
jgi:hypothetical protein